MALLADRLDRLSVDSLWARRAAGVRRNILRILDETESGTAVPTERMLLLIDSGLKILRNAAVEIPDLEAIRRSVK